MGYIYCTIDELPALVAGLTREGLAYNAKSVAGVWRIEVTGF
jgi:hypothetical protein